jgi:hypothetical protein
MKTFFLFSARAIRDDSFRSKFELQKQSCLEFFKGMKDLYKIVNDENLPQKKHIKENLEIFELVGNKSFFQQQELTVYTEEYLENLCNCNEIKSYILSSELFQYRNSDIYFIDDIKLKNATDYWETIENFINRIIHINSITDKDYEFVLVLHKSYTNILEDYIYGDDVREIKKKYSLKNNISKIYNFHHVATTFGIYKDIIINKDFWNAIEQEEDKSRFLLEKLSKIFAEHPLNDVFLNIGDKYYYLYNGKEIENIDDFIKNTKNDFLCKKNNITKYRNEEFVTLFPTLHSLEDRDFFIHLADFQLCSCDVSEYLIFKNKCNSQNQANEDYTISINSINAKHKEGMEYKPIIIFGKDTLEDMNNSQSAEYDRKINYLDSSIWLQYVTTEEEYAAAKNNIKKNKDLYKTTNAKEICDFRARLLKTSFLEGFDENFSHANHIAPFIFHSETDMQKKAVVYKKENEGTEDCELEKLNKKENLEWRFLIVDDHATEQSVREEYKQKIIPKCKIIYDLLSEYFNIKCQKCEATEANKCCKECHSKKPTTGVKNITIWFDCAVKMKEAINKLAKTKYDLILMDYLLDKEKRKTVRNYAYNLLHEIEKRCEGDAKVKKESKKIEEQWKITNHKIGPNGKLQMFYISAFTNAVRERMLEQCLDYNSDHWHISHGACPTTTPHLFLFYLLRRMNSQIKEFTELSTKHSKKEDLKGVITLLDLLQKIYGDDNKPRRQAIKLFNPLLKLRLNYDNLKYDVYDVKKKEMLLEKHASKLISSLFPDIKFYDNAFWEHTMHLVYLTAFGTIRQWHEMWDEFMLIKSYLKKANKKIEIAEAVIEGIEKYITNLQDDQSK